MKTAVEKLASEISKLGLDLDKTIELVRLMHEALDDEKEQITEAFNEGMVSSDDYFNPANPISSESLNYYKEIYNK